jgi:hypothetical protein
MLKENAQVNDFHPTALIAIANKHAGYLVHYRRISFNNS